jgi:hypothetical protein
MPEIKMEESDFHLPALRMSDSFTRADCSSALVAAVRGAIAAGEVREPVLSRMSQA